MENLQIELQSTNLLLSSGIKVQSPQGASTPNFTFEATYLNINVSFNRQQKKRNASFFSEKFVDGKAYTNGISNGHGVSQNGVSQNVVSQNGVSQFKKKPEFKTAEECKSALEKAVIRRCMADVEIGLLLSGGLDSSILGALMIQPHIRKHLTG